MRKVQDEWSNFNPESKTARVTVVYDYSGVPEDISDTTGEEGGYYTVIDPKQIIKGGTIETDPFYEQPGRASGGFTVASAMYEVAEGGKPELYSEGSKTYLLTGSQGGMVTPAKSNSQSQQSYPTAKEIGKATGDALAVKLQQLGLV
jgi:hypothetical protein